MTPRGIFLVLDGLDGCGKSTQALRLVARLQEAGRTVLHTREPGGTPLGERVRALLLDPDLGEVAPLAEVFLYQASRAQLVDEVIQPALARGDVVVCERWHFATTAYQGAYAGMGRRAEAEVLRVSSQWATGGTEPDRALLLDLPEDAADRRVGDDRDRLEQRGRAYRACVAAGFRAAFTGDPARLRTVQAAGTIDEVADRVWEAVRDLLA